VVKVAEHAFKSLPKLADSMAKFKKEFKDGMEKHKPKPFKIVKQVLGKVVEIEEGKTSEKELDKWAVTAGLYAELRPEIKNAVWKEMEPDFDKEIPEHVKGHMRTATLKAVRKAEDVLVDKLLDSVLEKVTKKIEDGEGFNLPKLDDMVAVIDALKNPGKAVIKAKEKDKEQENQKEKQKDAAEEKKEQEEKVQPVP